MTHTSLDTIIPDKNPQAIIALQMAPKPRHIQLPLPISYWKVYTFASNQVPRPIHHFSARWNRQLYGKAC
jgi:hypothetical protein